MTNRAPGTYLDRLHSKPWFHSGKVAEIKYSYSASGLTPSLYPIRPRSKVPGGDDRLAKLEFKTYPNIDQLTKQNLFVDFREYQFLRDYETLVTVEHCDSCETHANSTHHDPKQYSSLAQSLSNTILARYPSVKVMIKPISRLGMNYMRIGAFEVQICSKSNGSLNKNTLHSKLQTKKWPDLQEIVMKLSDYLPRCHISVTVFDIENGDNLLKEMHVSLRPKRLGLQLSTTMRPKSASFSTFRPGSAISTMSLRTIKFSARRNARTLLKSGKKQNKSLEGVTNREGVCLFNHVPMNIYEIEVGEDKEYRGEVKVINMFEELTQNSNVNIYVGLIPKNECELTVNLYDPGVKTEIPYAHVKLIDSSQGLHYLYEVSRGKYQLSVPKGVYVLRVDSDDFKELSKELQLLKTELIITENLKQKDSRDVQILTFNALTGDKLGGVLIKLKTSETQGFMQGLSRSGSYTYNLTHTGLFNVECFKKGYYDVNVTTYI